MTDRLDVDALLADLGEPTPEGFRAGLACFVGRPNVGKSTLLNAMLGRKVAIVTDVPGTTRNTVRGVVERDDAQLVVVDTPGVARPSTVLSSRLNDMVRETWRTVDVICLLVDAHAGIGKGDRFLAQQLREVGTPVVVVVTKEDLVRDKRRMMPILTEAAGLVSGAQVVPTAVPAPASSAKDAEDADDDAAVAATLNLDTLVDVLVAHLPEGPRLLPQGTVTDQSERHLAAEVVREKLIGAMQQELPHSIAVTVDEIVPSEDRDDVLVVDAVVHVERDSQKGIVIGKGGANLKTASAAARVELEALLGARVFLTTHVKVAKEWQRDPKQLRRLGW